MKLAVVTPWGSPFMYTKYVDGMLSLQRPTHAKNELHILEPLETVFLRGEGWCPARRHLDGCEKAVRCGADLICIVGADQIHPPDMLCRLIDRWNQGYEVVAALVPTRGYIDNVGMRPFQPLAYIIPKDAPGTIKLRHIENVEHEVDIIDPSKGEMQKVHFIGSGVLMFHSQHLKMMHQPWFFETVNFLTQNRLACMDTKFVWRLQTEAHAQVWVDTTIKVRHIHDMEIDESFQYRFEDWADRSVGERRLKDYSHAESTREKAACGG